VYSPYLPSVQYAVYQDGGAIVSQERFGSHTQFVSVQLTGDESKRVNALAEQALTGTPTLRLKPNVYVADGGGIMLTGWYDGKAITATAQQDSGDLYNGSPDSDRYAALNQLQAVLTQAGARGAIYNASAAAFGWSRAQGTSQSDPWPGDPLPESGSCDVASRAAFTKIAPLITERPKLFSSAGSLYWVQLRTLLPGEQTCGDVR
jgi:hypothetical protein